MKNRHAVALGRRTSPAKADAARKSGALGGRPSLVNSPDEFWGRVVRGDGCWLLPSRTLKPSTPSSGGYRQLNVGGRIVAAHRYAYELSKGAIPDGLDVLHSCDNRGCVRPDHLSLGTALENGQDRAVKGRKRGCRENPDYIVRDIDDALYRTVKAKAAMRGESIRDVIVRLLTKFAE